jgi:lysophospholipase L1-like esterase
MKTVLCYGDSNTWGQTAADRPDDRYGPHERWPGVMRDSLGSEWLVIEEGLSGRTTVSDDPIEGAEKNGRVYLKPCLQSHKPLDLVILMLGTNDLKIRFNKPASEIAMGIGALILDIKALAPGHENKVPEILVISPPPICRDLKGWESVFDGAFEKSYLLATEYERIADAHGARFLDAGSVVNSSEADGFHLDIPGHRKLGQAVADWIASMDQPEG